MASVSLVLCVCARVLLCDSSLYLVTVFNHSHFINFIWLTYQTPALYSTLWLIN